MTLRRIAIRAAKIAGAGILLWLTLGVVLLVDAGWPARSFRNVSTAMDPSLLAGETFTVSLSSTNPLHRDELVAHLWPPDTSKQFVKRVVGIPGDTLAMANGRLVRNGAVVGEPYVRNTVAVADATIEEFGWQREYLVDSVQRAGYRATRASWGPIVVPSTQYFVLGDNRDNSLDSRYWGFVSAGQIVGRPRRVYFSRDPRSGNIRWNRIGRRLQ